MKLSFVLMTTIVLVTLITFGTHSLAKLSNSVKVLLKQNEQPTPIVLWHGLGDNCCNPLSLGYIKKLLEKNIPGVYVYSVMIGSNFVADTEHSFFGVINEQVNEVCEKITSDDKLQNGYNAIGFSQGAQFLRAVAQRCPNPPMKNLISLGGQHQGVYGLPRCPGDSTICDKVRQLLDYGAYFSFVQNRLIPAQYWHDPTAEATYRENSIFLADINNENKINATYKSNLLKLKNLVLVYFLNDTMVVPKETQWFEYYEENDTSKIVPLEKSKIYTEDRIGLRGLHDTNRLQLIAFEGDHLEIKESLFISQIIKKYLR